MSKKSKISLDSFELATLHVKQPTICKRNSGKFLGITLDTYCRSNIANRTSKKKLRISKPQLCEKKNSEA